MSVREPAAVADGLVRARTCDAGVDAARIEAFLDDAAAAGLSLHTFALHRRGQVAVEIGWWPYRVDGPRVVHSVAKSFTACAIGMALDEGRFTLADRVVSFFPEAVRRGADEKLAAMTVEDLLTMRIGHSEETSGSRWRGLRTSWIEEFFRIPVVHWPGTVYTYTSAASYMLSAILTRVSGLTLHDYLRPRLFEPLGIQGETWDIGPDGINPGGNGLKCTTLDMLKLGVLHAQGGVWNGRRILSESWVSEATRAHSATGYGYHWMSGQNGIYTALGVFGQMVVVFPHYGATLAITAAVNGTWACERMLLPIVYKHFPAAFRDDVQDAEAQARLDRRLHRAAAITLLAPSAQAAPGRVGVLAYSVQDNALGITGLRLNLARDKCTLYLTDAQGEHAIEMGVGSWIESETYLPGSDLHHGYDLRPARVVAAARWLDPNTLQMSWLFVETAFQDTVVCRFDHDSIRVSRHVNVNSGPLSHPELIGRAVAA